uniref:Uncharacterized protein n=1 Tax=Hemiselmis andersenii TaxID=464988 RepID=A0A6U5BQ19_HEMAN|mmetsp:Transcript_57490/g.138851  ORF Transcript_57490/g.138851 Transcript_57490/m.138851 type:complete len:641 (+) Transcript_57490:80-2002(+)
MKRKCLRKEKAKRQLEKLQREDLERRFPRRSWAQTLREWGVVGGGRARSVQANGLLIVMVFAVVMGRVGTQTTTYYTIPELTAAQSQCHVQETQARCEDIKTKSNDMISGLFLDATVDTFINDATFENACQWNPLNNICEYRCNWNYNFQAGVIADRMENIREPAHYIYLDYGAACQGFNRVPNQNGNKLCDVCADPNFNPPECYLKVDKDSECVTRCNMLPNCTSVCTSVLKASAQYATKTTEQAYMDCCVPQRQQINGENFLSAREQCCRDWYLVEGLDLQVARNNCCNTIRGEDGLAPYCASEECHFKIMEQNVSAARDLWVEEALLSALATDCVGSSCGILGEVTLASDGVLGSAMVNNALLQAEGPTRVLLFFQSFEQSVIFDAILDSTAVLASTGIDTPYPTSVEVQQALFRFNVYFKECSVVKPCQLQQGILWDQMKLKYDILLRALLASGRHPDQVEEITYREIQRAIWEDTLPPYVPNVPLFNVPKYVPRPANLPVPSAIDHFNARQATRRRSDGETRAMEYGPAAGLEVVPECVPPPGLMCISGTGARKMNRRRSMCRPTSLWRPDEVPYRRPDWRIEMDTWMSTYGELGMWREDMYTWRRNHTHGVEVTRRWLNCYEDPDTCTDVVDIE